VSGGSTTTTRYFGPHFEVETRGSLTIYRHYVFAGGQAVAQYERRSSGSPLNDIQYLHRDHRASVVATTNAAGTVRQRFEYDAFGGRTRSFGSGADDTERGYTGHEHLDAVELTHMNGRVQDPELGRFVSADPFVQAPYHSQSLTDLFGEHDEALVFYGLRHTFITALERAGVDRTLRERISGHAPKDLNSAVYSAGADVAQRSRRWTSRRSAGSRASLRDVEYKHGHYQLAVGVAVGVKHVSEAALMRPARDAFVVRMLLGRRVDTLQHR
jgi:RHS repeat-associated protein